MCKSLYFLVGKVADCVNFVSALLLEAQSTPFQITPSTMANIVKGLYTLRPGKKEKRLYWSHPVIVICLPKSACSLTNAQLTVRICCVLCIIMLSSTLVLVAYLSPGQGTMWIPNTKKKKNNPALCSGYKGKTHSFSVEIRKEGC